MTSDADRLQRGLGTNDRRLENESRGMRMHAARGPLAIYTRSDLRPSLRDVLPWADDDTAISYRRDDLGRS